MVLGIEFHLFLALVWADVTPLPLQGAGASPAGEAGGPEPTSPRRDTTAGPSTVATVQRWVPERAWYTGYEIMEEGEEASCSPRSCLVLMVRRTEKLSSPTSTHMGLVTWPPRLQCHSLCK